MLNIIYADCYKWAFYAECHYAECCYAECRGAHAAGLHILPGVESVGIHGGDGGSQEAEFLYHLLHDLFPEFLPVGKEVQETVLEPLNVEPSAVVLVRLVGLVLVSVVPDGAADSDSQPGKRKRS